MRCAALLVCATMLGVSSAHAGEVDGHWEGAFDRGGARLPVRFDFETHDGVTVGRFSADAWGVMEWPIGTIRYTAPEVHFALGGAGADSTAFDGALQRDRIEGRFAGAEGAGTFALVRAAPPPTPYRRQTVTFVNGAVTLAGTLLMPRGEGPYPAVIVVQGSGGQTRWGTPLFFADRFARRGVAALAFDKRGSGASSGSWQSARYEDLADDVIAAMRLLQRRPDIRRRKIGLFGHSEGATIAPLVDARSHHQVAFIIAADGVAGPMYRQDLFRVRKLVEANGFSAAETDDAMRFYRSWLEVARTGNGRDELDALTKRVARARWFELVAPPPPDHWAWTEYRKRANFDSLPYWRTVRAPVLLVYGENDEKVPADESIAAIEAALRAGDNEDYGAVSIPGAEHNLTVHPKGGPPYRCPMDPQIVRAEPGRCPICKMPLEGPPPSEWWHLASGLPDLLTAWSRQHCYDQR